MVQRIGFEVVNNDNNTSMSYDFNVNPTNMSENRTQRTVVIPTKQAISVQDFGPGATYFTISGTTGYSNGFDKMQELKAFLVEYQNYNSDNISNDYTFIYHDYTNNGAFYVKLNTDGFTFSRDAQTPLLYNYSISMVSVGDAGQASAGEKNATVLGNISTSLTDGTSRSLGEAYMNPYSSSASSGVASAELGTLLEAN